jgi:hypothetical protein
MFLWANRRTVALVFAVAFCLCAFGCSGDKEEGAESGTTPEAEISSSSSNSGATGGDSGESTTKIPAGPSKREQLRQKLAMVFTAAYCAQKQNSAGDRTKLYSTHGFKDPADWAKQYHKEAKRAPEWAESVLEEAMKSTCE